jgi:DNA-binding XRE family transcriptional regulator
VSASWTTGIALPAELLPRSTAGTVFYGTFDLSSTTPLRGSRSLSSYMASAEANPQLAARLAAARQRHASAIDATPNSLRSLRLKAGLSQAGLAIKIGVGQSYIARVECSRTDPGTDMIVRIADGLNTSPENVFLAVRAGRGHE